MIRSLILHYPLLLGLTFIQEGDAFTQPHRPRPIAPSFNSNSEKVVIKSAQFLSSVAADVVENKNKNKESSSSKGIRPLHQNWWPVSITTSLQPDRPNAIELLGQKLVLYRDDGGANTEGGKWTCLDDRCSHRFAPLSEGRIVVTDADDSSSSSTSSKCSSCSIQCAYHGWEFNTEGKCTKVPQYQSSNNNSASSKTKTISERIARTVPSYPVREEAGMIWVWSDPDPSTWEELAESIPLPISPLVRNSYKKFGGNACFMRDLPYGVELLGENLLDLSHLPFSHHSVGGLKRDLGGELPLRVMSEGERIEYAKWEDEFSDDGDNDNSKPAVVPLHQVEVQNATQTDPVLQMIAERFPSGVGEDANSTIAFFEPCHVRYRRERLRGYAGQVELFMSPTRAGESRVFLWNTAHTPPPPPATTIRQRLAKYSPPTVLKKVLLAKLMNPATTRSHFLNHAIFDGDGIFLHKQGNRMRVANRSFRDYSTPSSADVLLNAYRRYLDAASKLSIEQCSGNSSSMASSAIAASAAEAVSYGNNDAYGDDAPRSQMLDRYNTHTKNCAICSAELEKCEKKLNVCRTAKTALVGATGASTVALLTSLASRSVSVVVPSPIVRAVSLSVVASLLGSIGVSRKEKGLEKTIQSFRFEDYVHAEKN